MECGHSGCRGRAWRSAWGPTTQRSDIYLRNCALDFEQSGLSTSLETLDDGALERRVVACLGGSSETLTARDRIAEKRRKLERDLGYLASKKNRKRRYRSQPTGMDADGDDERRLVLGNQVARVKDVVDRVDLRARATERRDAFLLALFGMRACFLSLFEHRLEKRDARMTRDSMSSERDSRCARCPARGRRRRWSGG